MKRREFLAAAALGTMRSFAQRAAPSFQFVDIARSAGLVAPVVYGGVEKKRYILETNGCGIAFFDYDHDGWLDIYVPGGTLVEGDPAGATNRLYHNNRDGTFRDVTRKAGLERVAWSSGVCIGDYNNDGFDDLFVSCWGQNILYRNNGDGTFTDVTRKAGLLHPTPQWGAGCTFLDYNRDGFLDLFVSTYLDFDFRTIPQPGATENCMWKGIAVNCGPRGLPTGRNFLYRNNGDGTFTDVSQPSGIAKADQRYAMTAVAADFDDDGWPDIFVACDSTPSILYRNNHDGTFTDTALEAGVAYNEDGRAQAGMGVAVADVMGQGGWTSSKRTSRMIPPSSIAIGAKACLKTHRARGIGRLYPLRRVGGGLCRFRQRRIARSLLCERQRLSRNRKAVRRVQIPQPAHAAAQSGQWKAGELQREQRAGSLRSALQPRLRIRRLRQRR